MDDLDHKLLSALAADSSTPVTKLAQHLGVARSTVQARIERLERTGTIAGYTIRLGETENRRRIRATALLQVDPRSTPGILQRLKPLPQVESCTTTTGRVDLIVLIVSDTTQELDETLDRIGAFPGVRATESLIHLGTRLDRRT